MLRPYCIQRDPKMFLRPNVNARTFLTSDLIQLYNLPVLPNTNERKTIVIVSFGGGVFGTIASDGTVTGGDFEPHWRTNGLTTFPVVKVQLLGNARNLPVMNQGETFENCLDVETVGAVYKNANIILLIAENTMAGFLGVFQAAKAIPGVFCISCSWGLPETTLPASFIRSVSAVFQQCADLGINITAASGDHGSSDGTTITQVDFPGSSPYVVCCGGTCLKSASNTYDSKTEETVWNNNARTSATGGGKSVIFDKPNYQQALSGTQRCTPDVGLNSDPLNAGMIYRVGGTQVVLGGTSCCSPFMAGYLALIGCNTFVNPLLYTSPRACFHDIVSGNNGEYKAGIGYDMCSGLGSIDGQLLKNAIYSSVLQVTPASLVFTNREPKQLTLKTIGAQTKPRIVTWSSSNLKIATVNTSGLVTPISNGTCTITCSAASTLVSILVSNVAVLATALTILPQLAVRQTLKFVLSTITPSNSTTQALTWTSSNPRIATVHPNTGTVTGVSVGKVTISAKVKDVNAAYASVILQIVATL